MNNTAKDRAEEKKSDFSVGLTFRLNDQRRELNITGAKAGKPTLISRAKDAIETQLKEMISEKKEDRRRKKENARYEEAGDIVLDLKEDGETILREAADEAEAVEEEIKAPDKSGKKSKAALVTLITVAIAVIAFAIGAAIIFYRCFKYFKKFKSIFDFIKSFRRKRK